MDPGKHAQVRIQQISAVKGSSWTALTISHLCSWHSAQAGLYCRRLAGLQARLQQVRHQLVAVEPPLPDIHVG